MRLQHVVVQRKLICWCIFIFFQTVAFHW